MRRTLPALAAVPVLLAAGLAHAEPVDYKIDPNHTYPSFAAPHMGISLFRGKFNSSSGTVTLDREARSGSVDIQIDAASVDFGHDKMNEHARGADFFDVETYPTIRYTGTIEFEGDTPSTVDGELTMIGETRPVRLGINSFKCIEHPMLEVEVCGVDASATIDRADFGMNYAASSGTRTELSIQAEALKQ